MRSMWIGGLLIALATSAWANGKDTATLTKEREKQQGGQGGKTRPVVVEERKPGVRPGTNPTASRLANRGLRGWQDGATRYGFTATEVVQADQQRQIGGRTVGWWGERARANLTRKQLPLSHMNLSRQELTQLLTRHVIDENDFLAIGYARGESW